MTDNRRLNRVLAVFLAALSVLALLSVVNATGARASTPSGVDRLTVEVPRYERCSALIELPVRASTKSGYDADIKITWGDGTSSTGSLTSGQRHVFQHAYASFGAHTVTVQATDSMSGQTDPMGEYHSSSGPTQAVIETVNKSPGSDTPCKDETATRRDWLNNIFEAIQVGLGSVHITDPPKPRPAPGTYPEGYEGSFDRSNDYHNDEPHHAWEASFMVWYVRAWC